MRRAYNTLIAVLSTVALTPLTAHAQQAAKLHVTFTPYDLGHATNIAFALTITSPAGRIPPPLTGIDVLYPRTLGLDVSGLGITTCPRATLEEYGPPACPADSYMGEGSALAAFPIEGEILDETATVSVIRAQEAQGHIAMYFNVTAKAPVLAEFVLEAVLLPAPAPYERIHIEIPLIPTFPDAPDAAVVAINANLGPHNLTYYEHTRGKLVPYKPQGILLPNKCPHLGFTFQADLTFANETAAVASTRIPCPTRKAA